MINLTTITEAKQKLNGIISDTPFTFAPRLTELTGSNIFLKKENLQLTGAFKIRGAFNKISNLSQEAKEKGVIAASAGNHAGGVAYSSKYFNIKSTIVMPEATPLTKITRVEQYGANVILHGKNYDEAYEKAIELSQKDGLTFIHPFADDEIISGQGTIGIEILEKNPNIDMIVVPLGGGGLIAGVAIAAKAIKPDIKIIGVSAAGAPALTNSFKEKKAIDSLEVKTIADGIAVRDTNPKNLELLLENVDDIISVTDEEIATAILFLMEQQKLIVEGAGATVVAAVLHEKIPNIKDKNIALVLSGGNIDVTMLSVIIEKGLIKSNRKMKFVVTLVDKPGSLMTLTKILAEVAANIVQIDYDRTSVALDYGQANVIMAVETKGDSHQELIKSTLEKNGYKIKELI